MSYTNTTRLALKKADIGSNQAFETSVMNANWEAIDDEAVAVDGRLDVIETAVGDGTGLATLTGTQTLTNKTLTAPVIATITNSSNTLTLPTTADTLVGRATTDTLTNKTLTAPVVTAPTVTHTVSTTASTTYTLLSTDASDFIYTTSSNAVTFTVANVLSPGQYVNVIQVGSGQVSFVAGSGVTLNSIAGNKKISAAHGAASIICISSGVYQLVGSLSA